MPPRTWLGNQIVKDRVNHLMTASMPLEQVKFEEATLAFKEKRKPKFGGK